MAGRGRPRKEPDIEHPRRAASREMIADLLRGKEGVENGHPGVDKDLPESVEGKGYDKRPITIETARATAEQDPPAPNPTDWQDAENVADIPVDNSEPTYYCQSCDYPLTGGESYCGGCGVKLDWKLRR